MISTFLCTKIDIKISENLNMLYICIFPLSINLILLLISNTIQNICITPEENASL